MSLNQVSLIGRLTADPKLRTAGEYEVSDFGLAVNDGYGEKEKTSFIDCRVWGKTASFANQYLKKGSLVAISGRLQQDSWEKEGKKYSKVYVVGNTLDSLEPKKKDPNMNEDINPDMIPF